MKKNSMFTIMLGALALGLIVSGARASETPELVLQTRRAEGPLAFYPAPTGNLLATGRAVWDVQSGKMLRYFSGRMTENTFDVAFDKTGQLFAAAGQPHCIEVWNTQSGEEKYFFNDFKNDVTAVAFAPNRNALAGIDESGALAMYDLDTGKQLWKIAAHAFGATSVAFSPDGTVIATAGYAQKAPPEAASDNWQVRSKAKRAREIKLWDAATGRALSTYALEPRLDAMRLFFHPNGKFLIVQTPVAPTPESIVLAMNGGKLAPAKLQGLERIEAISGDGKLIAHWVSTPGTLGQNEIRIWDTTQSKDIQTLETGANHARFDPLGQSVALDFGPDYVATYNIASGQQERRFSGQVQPLEQCAVGAGGAILATVHEDSWEGGRVVQLWNAHNGQELYRLTGAQKPIRALALSRDEKLVIAAADDNKIFVWDAASGKPQTPFTAETDAPGNDIIQVLAVSPDKSTLAIGTWSMGKILTPDAEGRKDDTYQISLWDLPSHKLLKILPGDTDFLSALVFSSDGKVLFSASDDETIRAWDVAGGTEKWKVAAHDDKPSELAPSEIRLALSPDGNTLAAGLNRGTIKLLDADSGREIATLAGHEVGVSDLCFAPDGRTLYSSGWDGRMRVWEIPSGKLEREQAIDYWETLRVMPENRLITADYDGLIEWRNAADGKPVATLAPAQNGGAVIVTPQGYYLANREALDLVAYRVGMRAYGFEQFDLYFNQPAKVLRALGDADQTLVAAYQAAYEKRLHNMGVAVTKGAETAPPSDVPEVSLDTRLLSATTDKARMTIPFSARVALPDSLARLLVWVNGVPVRFGIDGKQVDSDGFQFDGNRQEYSGAVDVELSSLDGGRNKIEVAVQSADLVESRREVFEVTYKAPLHFPDLYIVAIGVSNYANPAYKLSYADKDADDMVKLWNGQAEKWNEVHVRLLANADVTRKNIMQLKEFLAASQPDDEVIVSLSGHGLLDDKENYFFGTYDINFDTPEKAGLSYSDLESLLNGIGARRKLLLMDTCHAGEIDKDDPGNSGAKGGAAKGVRVVVAPSGNAATRKVFLSEPFADLRRGNGAEVIAATGGLDVALENPAWQNGALTYAVLEGLKTRAADADKDGHITVSELRDYVDRKVLALTNGEQRPVARQENLDSDFVVY
jgi:WD40 repeat protein